jgi:hypothetical protein
MSTSGCVTDDPLIAVLAFDSGLDPDQMGRIEHMPRWLSTIPSIDPASHHVLVNVRLHRGDDLDAVDRELREWLQAHGLPQGRRLPMFTA